MKETAITTADQNRQESHPDIPLQNRPLLPPLFPINKDTDEALTLEQAVNNFERKLIVRALEKSDGVQTKAAELLGTTRRILRYRIDKLGIEIPAGKQS